MKCTVTLDERLLAAAGRVLGTAGVQATIEASLEEVVRMRGAPVTGSQFIRTDAELQQYIREAQRPRSPAEQAVWNAAVAAAQRHQIDAPPDFNVVAELRELRRRSQEGLPADLDEDGPS